MKISLVPFSEGDIQFAYELRNHPDIRKKMLRQKPISWKTHLRFWINRIGKGKDFIMICDKKKVGVARLDPRRGYHEVSILITPQFQGKGIGTRILSLLKGEAQGLGIKRLGARIRCDNNASRKLFEQAGFKKVYCYYEW